MDLTGVCGEVAALGQVAPACRSLSVLEAKK